MGFEFVDISRECERRLEFHLKFKDMEREHFQQALLYPQEQIERSPQFWGHDVLEHFVFVGALRKAKGTDPRLKAAANILGQGPGIGERLPTGMFELNRKPDNYVDWGYDRVVQEVQAGIIRSVSSPDDDYIKHIFPLGDFGKRKVQIHEEDKTDFHMGINKSYEIRTAQLTDFHKQRYAQLGLDPEFNYTQDILDNVKEIALLVADQWAELHELFVRRLQEFTALELPQLQASNPGFQFKLKEIGNGLMPLQKPLVSWYIEEELFYCLFDVLDVPAGVMADAYGQYYAYDCPELLPFEERLRSFFAETPLPMSLSCVMHPADYYLQGKVK